MSDYINNIEKKPNAKKDILTSFLIIIAVFVFVFLFVTIREHGTENIVETIIAPTEEKEAEKDDEELVEEILDEDVDLIEEMEEAVEEEEKAVDRTEESSNRTKETQQEKSIMSYYRITAERGEGLTHIARTALNKYLSDNNINLSAEQKVYAEDYIQKRMQEERDGSDLVLLDEEVKVSYSYVTKSVTEAQGLTTYQINNLTQFVTGS